MTNLQKFFNSSPGVLFIVGTFICLLTSDKFRIFFFVSLEPFLMGDRAHLLSLTALLIIVLGFASVAFSLMIGRIWDAIFYFFGGGYNRTEYEPLRTFLLERVGEGSEAQRTIAELNVQALYGTILHSYAPISYIEWLGRRWTTFQNAGLQATASFLSAIVSLTLSQYFSFESPHTVALAFFGLFSPFLTIYIGRTRLHEVLQSEEFFCKSLLNCEISEAIRELAIEIDSRGRNQDTSPEVDERL